MTRAGGLTGSASRSPRAGRPGQAIRPSGASAQARDRADVPIRRSWRRAARTAPGASRPAAGAPCRLGGRGAAPAGQPSAGPAAEAVGQGGRAAAARRDDPQPLSTALDGLLGDQGWRPQAAVGSVFGRWDQIVGADVAAHTRPDRFNDGELVVIADSTAWATQVRLLAGHAGAQAERGTRARHGHPGEGARPGAAAPDGSAGGCAVVAGHATTTAESDGSPR